MRVLIVDDHKMMRQGLRALLEREPDIEVVGEAENGRLALRLAGETSPDVVLMDVAMPSLNGVDATRQLLAACPRTKVVGLSMHRSVRFVASMLQAGASGYVLKDRAFDELIQAVREAAAGGSYLSPPLLTEVLGDYIRHLDSGGDEVSTPLSPRETEVLQLVAEGRSTKDAAAELCVSVKTIETHRRNIMRKTGIDTVAGLTKYAVREGLVDLG